MKFPVAFTWTLPEFNYVFMVMVKELSKILKYKGSLFLEHMQRQIKDLIFCMNRVHNNNDFEYFM